MTEVLRIDLVCLQQFIMYIEKRSSFLYYHVIWVTIDGVWIGEWIYWPLTPLELQVITAPLLISTNHQSKLRVFFQLAVSSPAVPWQQLLTVEILQLLALRSFLSGEYPATEILIFLSCLSVLYYDRRSVGQSVLVSSPYLGLMTRFFHCQTIAGFWYGAPSLTRGRVCLLQCTIYILLSQIWDQVPVFISPRDRVARLYPQALGISPSAHSQAGRFNTALSRSQSHIATDSQSVSLIYTIYSKSSVRTTQKTLYPLLQRV
jgi:hypothetical protein